MPTAENGELANRPESDAHVSHNAENDAACHRPECWCNGTGFRRDLGVPCNLPQLTDAEHAYVIPPGKREEG
jgi:hypothetical protein